MALETLRKRGAKGCHHVLDADIRDYFGSIDHEKLLKLVAKRISDRRVLKLVRGRFLGDATLTAAILDRLAMHAIRIDIDGPSYRQHVAKTRAGQPATPPAERAPPT